MYIVDSQNPPGSWSSSFCLSASSLNETYGALLLPGSMPCTSWERWYGLHLSIENCTSRPLWSMSIPSSSTSTTWYEPLQRRGSSQKVKTCSAILTSTSGLRMKRLFTSFCNLSCAVSVNMWIRATCHAIMRSHYLGRYSVWTGIFGTRSSTSSADTKPAGTAFSLHAFMSRFSTTSVTKSEYELEHAQTHFGDMRGNARSPLAHCGFPCPCLFVWCWRLLAGSGTRYSETAFPKPIQIFQESNVSCHPTQ